MNRTYLIKVSPNLHILKYYSIILILISFPLAYTSESCLPYSKYSSILLLSLKEKMRIKILITLFVIIVLSESLVVLPKRPMELVNTGRFSISLTEPYFYDKNIQSEIKNKVQCYEPFFIVINLFSRRNRYLPRTNYYQSVSFLSRTS